ncbi:hypothetical protein [Haloplanus rubicundus]|nr:hypothetical protein [Haloplanus rubicundus]
MDLPIGPRATHLLETWGVVAEANPTGPAYDLTHPTRSAQYRERLEMFVEEPSESNFEALWNEQVLASASEWFPSTARSLWSGTLEDLAVFFDEIRTSGQYDDSWAQRVSWGQVIPELYSRGRDGPIVSQQARNGLRKFGIDPASDFDEVVDQLTSFEEFYRDISGHVTASTTKPIPIYEEIDQLFALVTTATQEDISAEASGPRDELYSALRGYPASSATDRGPIEIDFEAATPAIDGHIAARRNDAYADLETDHWAGGHYETWKWDFAAYIANDVANAYQLTDLSADEIEPFFDAFWTNSDEYTDTDMLSTPVPQYLLGRWGVVQLGDFRETCEEDPERAAAVLSMLFSEDEHLVDRLEQFYEFAASDNVSDGNLLRIASTLLMGVYPDDYVNFQYQRFETFFSNCSNAESLETGFDARQYYRIVLACRDLRDAMQSELPDASMLDVHTLIRLYQDFRDDSE